ncbi:hypothetical protein BC828DRAFT_391527 [Blastocladiella britannica]|nr:hypothetical protein BC828DRAFT_391527 [Blastocladiella britannica]
MASTSAFADFLKRSATRVTGNMSAAAKLAPPTMTRRLELYNFSKPESISALVVGSDKELGGLSEAFLEHNHDPNAPAAIFRGSLSTSVPETCKYIASGYAGIKTRRLPGTLFGPALHDLSRYSYLEIVARDLSLRVVENTPPAPEPAPIVTESAATTPEHEPIQIPVHPDNEFDPVEPLTTHVEAGPLGSAGKPAGVSPRQFFLNIKATTYAENDLYQYPLKFDSDEWHTFQIPLRHFVLTQKGFMLEVQRDMPRDAVEAFSISVLRQDGPFHLEIASLAATNPPGLSDEELEGEMLVALQKGDSERVKRLEEHMRPPKLF